MILLDMKQTQNNLMKTLQLSPEHQMSPGKALLVNGRLSKLFCRCDGSREFRACPRKGCTNIGRICRGRLFLRCPSYDRANSLWDWCSLVYREVYLYSDPIHAPASIMLHSLMDTFSQYRKDAKYLGCLQA